jgi:hypothetical protein
VTQALRWQHGFMPNSSTLDGSAIKFISTCDLLLVSLLNG